MVHKRQPSRLGGRTIYELDPGLVAPLPSVLTQEEAERFLDVIKTASPDPLRDEAVFRLFLQTGCRLSELIGVRMMDVQLNVGTTGGEMTVGGRILYLGKGSKERWVPLTPRTIGALQRYMESRPNCSGSSPTEALFLDSRGEPIRPRAVYRAFRRCVEAAKLSGRGLTPHKLRHTCLTLLLESGADLRTIQEVAGHSSIEVTQIYTHVSSKRAQSAMDRHPLG